MVQEIPRDAGNCTHTSNPPHTLVPRGSEQVAFCLSEGDLDRLCLLFIASAATRVIAVGGLCEKCEQVPSK